MRIPIIPIGLHRSPDTREKKRIQMGVMGDIKSGAQAL